MKHTAGITALALVLTGLFAVPTYAGAQAERAIQGVQTLIKQGKISKDTPLKIVVKSGNMPSFLGNDLALKNEWETKTGILLDIQTMPQDDVYAQLKSNQNQDLTLARQHEYPTLFSEKLIVDLTPYTKKYKLITDDKTTGYFNDKAQMTFDNRIVAIPADGDVAILFLRKDLLEDPKEKEAFAKKYRHPLLPPVTWNEYQEQIEFFHRPDQNLYGCVEHRDFQTGWMFWMLRYVSQASPNQYLFDAKARPLLDSPQALKATELYLNTLPFSPTQVTAPGHYTVSIPIFTRGEAYAYIITGALAKIAQGPNSKIKDKFIAVPMPGTVVKNKLVRRSTFIYGNNLVVPAASTHPELAYLYAMWLTDPDISLKTIMVKKSLVDPYRRNHMTQPEVTALYGAETLKQDTESFELAAPEGTGLVGEMEYIASLSAHLHLAATGKITASQAMALTQADWLAISKKYRKTNQTQQLKRFYSKFPTRVFELK